MFLAFEGNPCPQIYFPMNIYTSICLILIYEIKLDINEITSQWTKRSSPNCLHWTPGIIMIQQYIMLKMEIYKNKSKKTHCTHVKVINIHVSYIVEVSCSYNCYFFWQCMDFHWDWRFSVVSNAKLTKETTSKGIHNTLQCYRGVIWHLQ